MYLKSLYAKNFRNFKTLKLDLKPGINLILGDNGVGKTNLVEIVYFLSTFGSFRTPNDDDLVRFGESYFIISGMYGDVKVEVRYAEKKKVLVNKVKQERLSNAFSTIPVIALTSSDLEIVDGAPVRRRRFMNIGISMYKRPYIDILSLYSRALKQRNSLLKHATTGKEISGIEIWEKQLAINASPIVTARKDYINRLLHYAVPVFYSLTGQDIEIAYKEGADYENLMEQFKQMRKKEIERGYTLYGPHRDDIIFKTKGHSAKVSASFGIKRLITIALRIAQARMLTQIRGEEPILILDEMIGELDKEKLELLSDLLMDYEQVLIATTREDLQERGDYNIYRIEERDGAPFIRKGAETIHSI